MVVLANPAAVCILRPVDDSTIYSVDSTGISILNLTESYESHISMTQLSHSKESGKLFRKSSMAVLTEDHAFACAFSLCVSRRNN